MTTGETAPYPTIRVDESATPEQHDALKEFEAIAGGFTDTELRSVISLVDRYPGALDDVLPLTKDPEATGKLFKSWSSIVQTEAYLVADFDEQTEQAIQQDPEFLALKESRDYASSTVETQNYRDAIIRFRFVTFGGRLATSQAVKRDEDFKKPA